MSNTPRGITTGPNRFFGGVTVPLYAKVARASVDQTRRRRAKQLEQRFLRMMPAAPPPGDVVASPSRVPCEAAVRVLYYAFRKSFCPKSAKCPN